MVFLAHAQLSCVACFVEPTGTSGWGSCRHTASSEHGGAIDCVFAEPHGSQHEIRLLEACQIELTSAVNVVIVAVG